ncbi:AmmeMemoRadiSam system protein A [Butyrivibrio sp. VCD2006]|uniref:AmmeMemoRadiSam system protein A n=1 Tax=Butyrivibrio sp. VCD2006 TaxID=1280664 RepID=UPI0004054D99|nr:AmmeMemoRadiSam system protein A [Butyrivibrio sp. VCD2006]
MPILGAFMVPHPPIMLPEVGNGEEKKIAEVTAAYEQVADEIASLKPDTIVISSPHSIMYADYFHISPGKTAYGDMGKFNAEEVSFDAEYDTELVDEICRIAEMGGADASEKDDSKDGQKGLALHEFPAGTMGERDPRLDHGTIIPLYYICKKYTDFKLVRIGLSGLPLALHYQMGQIIQKAVNNTGRRIVYVASGDLSHKMKEEGPYGFAPEGPQYDERIMEVCGRGDFKRLFEFEDSFCEKAAECGHRSFVMMAGALDGLSVKAEALVHAATFGVGYGICRFEVGGPDDSRHFLDIWRKEKLEELRKRQKDEDPYVKIARYSLESYVNAGKTLHVKDITGGKPGVSAKKSLDTDFENSTASDVGNGLDTDESGFDLGKLPEELFSQKAGAFVSIHKNGALRGCIGTISPTCDCVAEEILQNAISAGTNDPRFPMITPDELPWLEISVDVLDEPEPISSPDQLDVKRYGVIVRNGFKKGLLLPNLDGVDSVIQQINIACQKAGIPKGEEISLERFEVVRHI